MPNDPQQMREKLLASLGGPMTRSLDNIGITDEYLASKLKEEIDASLPKLFQSEGQVVESREVPVWDVRQRARQDAHKLRGDYPAERKHISVEGVVPVIPLSDEQALELEAMKEILKQRTKPVE
jgi:hypothetical protein